MSLPMECAGTSCWIPLSDLRNRVKKLTVEDMLNRVKAHCEGPAFQAFCEAGGMKTPTFHWNEAVQEEVLNRFKEACQSLSNTDSSVAAVFHGTHTHNIGKIMSGGLDPAKRSGQSYGPGEYFGKDPGTSSSYCHNGKQMCVFLVVVPKETAEQTTSEATAAKSKHNQFGNPSWSPRRAQKPFEMVVVENNNHQLPIGILKFSEVDAEVLRASNTLKGKLRQLNLEAMQKEKQAKVASTKAKIIQSIIQRELEMAGTIYNRNKSNLTLACKKEIAIYAFEHYDEEFISFFFDGGLPKPNQGHANEEFSILETRTVEQLEEEWKAATVKLDEESKSRSPALVALLERDKKVPRLGGPNPSV